MLNICPISWFKNNELKVDEKIDPLKKISLLVFHIVCSLGLFLTAMDIVSDSSSLILTGSAILSTGSLFVLTTVIYRLIDLTLSSLSKAADNLDKLCLYWENKNIKKI